MEKKSGTLVDTAIAPSPVASSIRFLYHHSSPVGPYNRGTGAGGDSNGEKADVATDSGDSITGHQRLFLLPMSSDGPNLIKKFLW